MPEALTGRRILLVEDEPIIALAIEDMLKDIGCSVIGPAGDISEAEELARNEVLDGAVLDINLSGNSSHPVASILRSRQIPFCFSTGYGSAELPDGFQDIPVVQKPYGTDRLSTLLRELLS